MAQRSVWKKRETDLCFYGRRIYLVAPRIYFIQKRRLYSNIYGKSIFYSIRIFYLEGTNIFTSKRRTDSAEKSTWLYLQSTLLLSTTCPTSPTTAGAATTVQKSTSRGQWKHWNRAWSILNEKQFQKILVTCYSQGRLSLHLFGLLLIIDWKLSWKSCGIFERKNRKTKIKWLKNYKYWCCV